MTTAGIEPATFRFVVQHLNHCATAVCHLPSYYYAKYLNIQSQLQIFLICLIYNDI